MKKILFTLSFSTLVLSSCSNENMAVNNVESMKWFDSITGKSAKTDSLPISDGLVMYLHGAGDSGDRYVRVDFNDYSTYKDFYMIMDKPTLKGMADFIYKYLENK